MIRRIAFASLWLVVGCGGGGRVVAPEETPPPPAVAAPAAPDAFRDFSGERVDAAAPFDCDGVGRAVRGVEAVVHIEQVKTSTWETPGGEEKAEGTAYVVVEKGQERRTLRIKDGEEAIAFGVRVQVIKAEVAYDVDRQDYVPKARLVVTPAP